MNCITSSRPAYKEIVIKRLRNPYASETSKTGRMAGEMRSSNSSDNSLIFSLDRGWRVVLRAKLSLLRINVGEKRNFAGLYPSSKIVNTFSIVVAHLLFTSGLSIKNFIYSTIVSISFVEFASNSLKNDGERGKMEREFAPRHAFLIASMTWKTSIGALVRARRNEKFGERRKRGRRTSL